MTQELKECYQCGKNNPAQAFCGECGAPLNLNAFIASRVKTEMTDSIQDRDVIEKVTALNVFEKVYGWMKLIFGIAGILLLVAGVGVVWKVSDFWTGVNSAKQSVSDTAKKTSDEITHTSEQTKHDITAVAKTSETAIENVSAEATQKAQALEDTANKSKSEITHRAASFQSDLDESKSQLQKANELEPQMADMQKRLTHATAEIQEQQKVLSSSEEFVKKVFSSHVSEYFVLGQTPAARYVVTDTKQRHVVFLLLQHTPIPQTLQLQYHVFAQPPNSFFAWQNLVVFFWKDSPENLKTNQLSALYFPDMTDKDLIKSLYQHDGRYYADDQPLPKFDEPDPDFKGNKWLSQPKP